MRRVPGLSRFGMYLSISRSRPVFNFGATSIRFLPLLSCQLRSLASRSRNTLPRNEEIARLHRVRLISKDGQDGGEMSGEDAWSVARRMQLDIMAVQTPKTADQLYVARLVDLAALEEAQRRKAYNERRKRKEADLLSRREGQLKQIRLTPMIGDNEFAMKMRQARDFLLQGYTLRVFMLFRRGQGKLEQNAKLALVRVAHVLARYGTLSRGDAASISVEELFPKKNPEDDELEAFEAQQRKQKPLDVHMYPVKREHREKLKLMLDQDDEEDISSDSV